MKIRRGYILLSLAIAGLLGLAYLNQVFFYAYLIKPIATILWFVYRTFLSVNQEIYWGFVVLATLILLISMIPNDPKISFPLAYRNLKIEKDRVKYWEALLKSAEESEYDRRKLQHDLEILNLSIGDLVEETDEDEILLPPFKPGIRQQMRSVWRSTFKSRIIKHERNHGFTELEMHVDNKVSSMETQLEIHND